MFVFSFIALHISILIIIVFTIFLFKSKNKKQIHYVFSCMVLLLFAWTLLQLIEEYAYILGYRGTFFNKVIFVPIIIVPIAFFYIGYIFYHTTIKFSKRQLLIFIIPVISLILLATNDYHHLFHKQFTILSCRAGFGPYYYIHTAYSYLLIFIGAFYLLYSSIKVSGIFSKQAFLFILGILIPLVINIVYNLGILGLEDLTAPSFSIAMVIWGLAIFKFKFLNIIPIALQKVVDHISDSFIVIDENYNIIDYNNTFYNTFKDLIEIKRSKNILNEISNNNIISKFKDEIEDAIKTSIREKRTITLEKTIKYSNYERTFDIDITSIFNHDKHIGTILLFKDITALKNAHKQLLEQERFSSLGQLIGGIAHDMNSRLYALDGQIYLVKNYANELKNNENLDKSDYIEIAEDILKQIDEMKISVDSMSKTIDSVRNHTRNYAFENIELFSMNKVIETIESLLNQKLKRHNCTLTYSQNTKEEIYIKGDFSKFESVLINIISNAIESYNINQEKKGGLVEVFAEDKQNEIIISVTDHGKGMPENIRDLIFKEVLTTKGANGTGMGLYFSHSIIVGNFNGDVWFESQVGKGTTFYIRIPK